MTFPLHSNEAGSGMSPPPLPPVDPPSSSPPQIPPSENPLSSSAPLLPAAAQTSQPRSPPSEEPPPASDTPLPDVVPPSSPRSQPLLPPSDPQPAPSIAVDTTETIMITASIPETPMTDSSNPSWFTPKRLLLIFCVINMLNYVDRGAIASNGVNGTRRTCTNGICTKGSGIQGAFNLNNFEDGLLSSAFMVGLLVASPIFASLAKTHNPFRLIGVGLSVWTFATAGCGCSFNFWSILIFRMLVGVGEASFISLAAPFIDDNAPPAQRTAWLGLFYMCIPAGVALGYVYGGVVGGNTNWRVAFWIEAGLMLPFVIIGFVIKPLQLKGFFPSSKSSLMPSSQETPVIIQDAHEPKTGGDIQNGSDASRSREPPMLNTASNGGNQIKRFFCDLKVLLLDKVYVVNVLGYISYNFVIGAYSYWGPKAGYAIYKMSNADMFFGGITIVCGILGTLAGGYILDYIQSTISNAFKLLSSATFVGAIFCVGAFLSPKLFGFVILFAVGELLVFATQVFSELPNSFYLLLSVCVIMGFVQCPRHPFAGVILDSRHCIPSLSCLKKGLPH